MAALLGEAVGYSVGIPTRPDPAVLATSATIAADRLAELLGTAPDDHRTFPAKPTYLPTYLPR
jgi:HrpA-like RNA helicase